MNDLQVIRVLPKAGLLVGFHPALNKKALVTYSSTYGMKMWFWHDKPEEVTNEEFLRQTREYLLDIAKEKGIVIQEAQQLHPAKLAHILFSKLVPELKS